MRRIGKLEAISFITGFSLLTYELAAARILAPTIGSSTYVWTSVIGVIIASLAFGFFIGGKLADKRDHITDLVWLLLLASLMVVATQVLYSGVLSWVVFLGSDVRVQAVIAASLLFAPTSFLIGMTSPYLAKLNVRSLKTTGQHVASLDALNSLGGIVGTFLTGFILFGYIGSHQTFSIVALLLLGVSWLISPKYRLKHRVILSVAISVVTLLPFMGTRVGATNIDTASAHYQVVKYMYNDAPITGLVTGPAGIQSAVYDSGSSDPVFWYTQELARLTLEEKPERILVLGGGAFTLPQYLAEKLPSSKIDVVEIDPGLKEISEKYFHYKNPSNVNLIFDDARAYVNQSNQTYDMILVDVYGDTSIPFSLITREYAESLDKRLSVDGRVVVNIIGGESGKCLDVLAAVNASYQNRFPYAYYSNQLSQPAARANYIVSYSRAPVSIRGQKPLQIPKQPLFTDNYAPAERLYYACEQSGR
ncbi:MAG TPA: fused MFS/spermidine synthase [Candidatus Saccharimonadales bacterium]